MEEPSTEQTENPPPTTKSPVNLEIEQEKPEALSSVDKSENSEYDSAGSYSDNEGEVEPRKAHSRRSEDSASESSSVILQREEGDGQESVPQKKVDDDEDKKNPQYIPKRGTFYEHDDRTMEDEEQSGVGTEAEKTDKDGKKKVWQDKRERWSHDRFNESEQAPKSRNELIGIYGYDIRNEDGPPRARRRRRYGRGPNKYTRNWEDEDAYNKPTKPKVTNTKKVRPKRNNREEEEFPPLANSTKSGDEETSTSKERPSTVKIQETVQESNGNMNVIVENRQMENVKSEIRNNPQQTQTRVGSGRVIKPKKEIKDSDYRGFTTKTRQVRNLKNESQKNIPQSSTSNNSRNQKREDFIQTQNFTNKNNNFQELEKDMSKMNIHDSNNGGSSGSGYKNNKQRQGSVPPRLQNEQKGSKRYSSMRQRSLPESATPPNFPTTFYPTPNEYNQQGPPPTSQQPILHQNTSHHPATTQVTQMPQQGTLPPIPQQVPVTAAPLLQPQYPPPPFPQPPPPFLQPGVAPPTFIPSQTPQIINYVQGQPTITPNYPVYQQQFNPVTQPTELYQPQGGITYYSTDQQVAQRSVPLKRPKAAIPIVAPPPGNENKGRGRKDDEHVPVSTEQVINDNKLNAVAGNEEQFVDIQQ